MKKVDGRLARLERMVANESKYYYYPPVDERLPLADKLIYVQEQENKAKALGKIARPFGYVEDDGAEMARQFEASIRNGTVAGSEFVTTE